MVDKRPALGRGLSALIPDAPASPQSTARALDVDSDLLTPNRFQPRTTMDDGRIEELARSIRSNGIIQPIVVRKADTGYEIIAGERRWRASQRAGLLKVPIVIRDIPDERMLAETTQARLQPRAHSADVADDVALLVDAQRLQGHGRGHRMRRIRVAMAEDAELVALR